MVVCFKQDLKLPSPLTPDPKLACLPSHKKKIMFSEAAKSLVGLSGNDGLGPFF